MNRKLLIGIVSGILAMGLHAETTRVLRFVPIDGAESEVALNSLHKVVFTSDSIVLISATDGEATPMYKYDYRSILFAESSPQEIEEVRSETTNVVRSEKFIKDGQLFIRREGKEYNVMGFEVR